jgi:hypothetical protein
MHDVAIKNTEATSSRVFINYNTFGVCNLHACSMERELLSKINS